jgi:hypothetical protein
MKTTDANLYRKYAEGLDPRALHDEVVTVLKQTRCIHNETGPDHAEMLTICQKVFESRGENHAFLHAYNTAVNNV